MASGMPNSRKCDAFHLLDAVGIVLGRAADGVQVDGAVLLQGGQGLGAHAAFADDRPDAEFADDVRLVGLLADAGGGAGRLDLPLALFVLQHHRAAVVDHAPVQVHRRVVVDQILVEGVAAGVDQPVQDDHVADAELPDLLFGDGRVRRHSRRFFVWRPATGVAVFFGASFGSSCTASFGFDRFPASSRHALPAERPAVVGHGDEEAGGKPVDRADLAAQQCHVAAEAHGADAQLVGVSMM